MPSVTIRNAPGSLKTWWHRAFSAPLIQQARWPWVDYLKGIGIILVVYRHVLIGIERSGIYVPKAFSYANMMFFSFRMPLFFLLSGLFISRSLAKRSLSSIIFQKFDKLIYPYFIWAFIQVTLQIIISHHSSSSANSYINAHRSMADYLYILYNPQRIDQFWYFPALFNATVVFLFVKTKISPPVWAHLLFGALLYFIAPDSDSASIFFDWMHYYIFFIIGDAISKLLLKESTIKLLLKNAMFFCVLPLFLLTQIYYVNNIETVGILLPIVVLTGCLMMLIISLHLQQKKLFSFIRIIGYHSIYIYIMHVMISALTRTIITKFFHSFHPVILLLSGILAGIIIPIVLYNLFLREKGWFLFSLKHDKYGHSSL